MSFRFSDSKLKTENLKPIMFSQYAALGEYVDISQNDPPRLVRNPVRLLGPPIVDPNTINPDPEAGLYDTTIVTNVTAADTRNAQELQQRIKAQGGAIRTDANSSDYIVAANNRLKFSITPVANGKFLIRESNYFWLVVGAAALVGLAVIAKK